ncbi:MAG: glycosyltransferase 87 family protein, partial [Planctomycetota bacterium]
PALRRRAPPASPTRGRLLLVLAVGLLIRAPFFFSAPILEDDAWRYLWDGAVLAHGLDPYANAPADLLAGKGPAEEPWPDLVEEGRAVLERVNHPRLKTIYPPVAQGAFALAHRLAPWKGTGLRLVWLALDLAVLGLLLVVLGAAAGRTWQVAIYWLNPLLVKEVYNSMHMEPVLLAFSTGALVLASRRRVRAAAGGLALAIGAKIWPVLWLPLVLRVRGLRRREAVVGGVVAVGLAAVLVLPLLWRSGESASGLGAYARVWEINDAAFLLVHQAAALFTPAHAPFVARVVVALLLLALLLRLALRPVQDGRDLATRALTLVAALFLLSPTAFPWYGLWLLPALAWVPRTSLLLLTVTLPLYYLRFRFADWGIPGVFDYGVVWIEFLPVWFLFVREQRRSRRLAPAGGNRPCSRA